MPREQHAWWQIGREQIKQFFLGRDSALNLAIVRIAVLATLLSQLDVQALMWIARLPAELQIVPNGVRHLLQAIPLNETTAMLSIGVCAAACAFGIVGLFSRTSCAVAALSGVYALMIGHLVPTCPHNHHLIWFAAILACSRCGDALSIDSLVRALQQARNGYCTRISRARCYAIPLRMIWILFGVIYFFPGFWKATRGYSEWIAGHTLIKAIHFKWALYGGWVSPFRIDLVPMLCKLGQLATVSFELLFIAAIFFPISRRIAAGAGLFFHNATALVMRVTFVWLQTCYVALIDWHALARHYAKARIKRRTIVKFENPCEGCRKSVALLRGFDLWRANIFTPATVCNATAAVDLHTALYAAESSEALVGGLAIPFSFFRRAFWQILRRLHQSSNQSMVGAREYCYTRTYSNHLPVLVVGVVLVLFNIRAGVEMNDTSWPFACYPEYIVRVEHIERLAMSIVDIDGKERAIDLTQEWPFLSHFINRKWSYVWPGRTAGPTYRSAILRATWSVLLQDHPDWKQAAAVRFYEESFSTDPDLFARGPKTKRLIYEMRVQENAI